MTLHTIGTSGRSAEEFFSTLRAAGVRLVLDTRLRPSSQLAAYAKAPDLAWLLRELCGAGYRHAAELAPTPELLAAYRDGGDWETYATAYAALLAERGAERIAASELDGAVLLCSERSPEHCHRRIAAEYLQQHHRDLAVNHLR